jgi:hypothetical protein
MKTNLLRTVLFLLLVGLFLVTASWPANAGAQGPGPTPTSPPDCGVPDNLSPGDWWICQDGVAVKLEKTFLPFVGASAR